MGVSENKELVRKMWETGGGGDSILAGLSDDVRMRVIGTTKLSGTINGKAKIVEWSRQFVEQYEAFGSTVIDNIIAEGDYVVLQMHGTGRRTKLGDYNNSYCMVCKVLDGKVTELTEYSDTELITSAFGR